MYPSITTPEIEHDEANMLAEFIWLNGDIRAGEFPWKQGNKDWGRLVAAIKRLMSDSYGLTGGQIAFYIWKCKPRRIDPKQFARMAVVARELFENYDLEQVSRFYIEWRESLKSSGLEKATYKTEKPKSLLSFLRELEVGKKN